MSENRVLRRIFEPKSYDVIIGSKKIHDEKVHGLYQLKF
jgi:hypothetical protein